MIHAPLAVLGAGSWGTALAIQLARSGRPVLLWGHDANKIQSMRDGRENRPYLAGVRLPPNLHPESDLPQVVSHSDDILIVVPSHAFRRTLTAVAPYLAPTTRVAWATKGLEAGSHKLLGEVARETVGEQRALAVISGPTFAREVALGLPTAVTIAANDERFANHLADSLHSERFRPYTSHDMIGVSIGGAVKNVLAIAAGIADGLGFGANTRAALVTRGLAEMMRLSNALGGKRETLMGLAGLGDLLLTCTDDQSRNRRFGLDLGRGETIEMARARIDQVIEGIDTAKEIHALAQRHGVEMPITEQVYRVLHENQTPAKAVESLLAREQKSETW
ncbi:MAG TPA: NAD(P)H-dependent glycerol-3-phosphate dehydrogenase [Gammaproteobacteria bacterium]|nr:NAD(P)H-dependent glycerol-3-phosphate dehydrogenase [Gammaproteobacteria bacterium]